MYPVLNTQELLLVVTQKSLLRSQYSGILTQEFILRATTQEFILKSKTPTKNSYISSSTKTILGGGAAKDGVAKRTLSHEMRVDVQKLKKNSGFESVPATLSHDMKVDVQKLRKN